MGDDKQRGGSRQPPQPPARDVGNETLALSSVPWEEINREIEAMPFAAPAPGPNTDAREHSSAQASGLPFEGNAPAAPVAKPTPGMQATMATDISPSVAKLLAQYAPPGRQADAQPAQTPPPQLLPLRQANTTPPAAPIHGAGTPSSPWSNQPAPAKPSMLRGPDPLREMPAPTVTPAAAPEPQPNPRVAPRNALGNQILQLIWYEPNAVARIRRHEPWRQLLDELEDLPPDPHIDDSADDDIMDVEDHRDTFEILSRADANRTSNLKDVLALGVRSGGKFTPPLALFEGTLLFPFDHVEELKATVSTATPFAPGDDVLGPAVDAGSNFLSTPHLLTAPDVTRGLIRRITEAFRRLDRLVPSTHLEDQTRRALLENRHYQQREMFGDKHIRALLQPEHNKRDNIPAYLPASMSTSLPMFSRLPVRLIASVEPTASEFETHAVALRILALGRLAPQP